MESLPEDVVVHILSFLPPRDLLGPVRAVCHAWRRLALHRDAWRNASVCDGDGCEVVVRALRLAPCLRSLEVRRYNSSPAMQRAIDTTDCQIQRLRIDPRMSRHKTVLEAIFQSNEGFLAHFNMDHIHTRPIRRLLRCLLGPSLLTRAFDFWWRQVPHTKSLAVTLTNESFRETLKLIHHMSLEELEIKFPVWDNNKVHKALVLARPFPSNDLKRLSVEYCLRYDPVVRYLVARNVASLQEFVLFDEIMTVPSTLNTLRASKNRLKLTVPASSITAIIGMTNVDHLTVRVFGLHYKAFEKLGLLALARGYVRPSSITLYCPTGPRYAEKILYDCLKEMGTLGRCGHVESLTIDLPDTFWERMVTPLTFLDGLSNLRELRLQYVSLDKTSLCAIRGLKSLQLLHLGVSMCSFSECCVPALWSVIVNQPGLHILRLRLDGCCQDTLILLRRERNKPYGLRGHCPAKCATCAHYWHEIGGRWHRLAHPCLLKISGAQTF